MKTHPIRSRLVALGAAAVLVLAGAVAMDVAIPEKANAAVASDFHAGNIISDEVFFNENAMGASQIQSIIAAKGAKCQALYGYACLKDYRQSTPSRGATAFCGAYSGQANELASQIIQRVGVACGINPQVLTVMLEKEQGLVTSSSPRERQYRVAMGYGCPDTAPCDAEYFGFFNQVYNAASQFQRYTKNSANYAYRPGRVNNILWNPDASCGSKGVFIENQATANLYIYTPYQPNAAALGNLYGTGDRCSAYGNRNFWVLFSDWFGSPNGGQLLSPSFEGGSINGWGASNGFINQQVAHAPSLAKDGEWFLATNTATPFRAMSQDVKRTIAVGEQATAKVWVRSDSARPFKGVVALWGLGGSTEQGNTPFTVTDTWTEVTVKLPVRSSSHSVIRLDVYLQSTDGTLWMDKASLEFGSAPPIQNSLKHPSFEGSFDGWTPGNGFMNQQIYNDARIVKHGSWFAASNTAVAGRSFAQEVRMTPSKGDKYTFRIALRSESDAKPMTGKLALWGLGGSQQIVSATDFVVKGAWQELSVTLNISASDVKTLKAEVYLLSANNTLFLDDALLGKELLTANSFEGGSFAGWGTGNGTLNHAVYPNHGGHVAADGGYFAAANTATPGGSLAQVVQRSTSTGDDYAAEVWVRSADPAKTFSGTLALWALGGTTEAASVPFTANGTWQKVRVRLPIAHSDHSRLKFEIYLGTTDNTLFIDGAHLY